MDYKHLPRGERVRVALESSQESVKEVCAFLNEYFSDYYGQCVVIEGYCPKGDIYSNKAKKYIEVKNDTTSHRTKNFFLEAKALSHSASYLWVYVDNDNYYFIRRAMLQEMIEREDFKEVMGGDDKKFKGWLIPVKRMRAEAKVYGRNWKQDPSWYLDYVIRRKQDEHTGDEVK